MRSTNQIDIIFLEETFDDSLAECVADATVILAPTTLAFFGVGPEQVTEEATFRHLSWPRDLLQLYNRDQLG